MRFLQLPDFDLVIELQLEEWERLIQRLKADLLLPDPSLEGAGRNYIARLDGAWILFLVRGEAEHD